MATRAIVTSPPVVACDVCGRRLLRGETPEVFLDHGERRTVCELCAPRASAEGWLREADHHDLSVRAARARRTGSLLGRLRQLREPAERPLRRETRAPRHAGRAVRGGESGLYHDDYEADDEIYSFLDGAPSESMQEGERQIYIGSVQADDHAPAAPEAADDALHGADELATDPAEQMSAQHAVHASMSESSAAGVAEGELEVERALEVFNASDLTQRIAGVARSLGAPSVVVRALEGSGTTVAIVVAWELCWYRYEVDLADEMAGPRLAADGMELDELPEHDRTANAVADERGRLALV